MGRERRHRWEWRLARALEAALGRLPESAALAVGAALGATLYGVGIRRRVTITNLARAFPHLAARRRAQVARAAYRHLGREVVATLRFLALSPEERCRRVELVGEGALRAALAHGRGALLVSGHFGNWEVAAAALAARGYPVAAVVRPLRNPYLDARLDAARRALGYRTIHQRRAPIEVPRLLRRNTLIGLVADQDAGRHGIFLPFFGHPAATARGPAVLARRAGAPALAAFAFRLPGRKARYRLELEPLPTEGPPEALVAAFHSRLEAAIRRAPEQYFWLHQRWKTPPPAEPPPALPGTLGQAEDEPP